MILHARKLRLGLSQIMTVVLLPTTLLLYLHTAQLQTQLQRAGTGSFPGSGESSESGGRFVSTPEPELEGLTAWDLNNTRHAKKETMFFNRVPKAGSEMMMELLFLLSKRNGFNYHKDKPHKVENIRMSYIDQRNLVKEIEGFTPPSVFIKHTSFINFTTFKFNPPIYVNIVRDPVERVISWYYYIRSLWYFAMRKHAFPELKIPNPTWAKKTFEMCVLDHDPDCTYIQGERTGLWDHRRQTLFYCTHDEDCLMFNSKEAFQRAKSNVESSYAVVGILEDWNKTMTVLENYIPRFFTGATQVYYGDMQTQGRASLNKNNYKPPVENYIKDLVRKNFTQEIEFYNFCRQRLHLQYKALKLDKS